MFRKIALLMVTIASLCVPAVAHADDWVRIENQSTFWIAHVYIAPSKSRNWGPDQLASDETILPGQYKAWDLSDWDTCYVDLKIISIFGYETQRKNVNVCGGFIWTIYDGK